MKHGDNYKKDYKMETNQNKNIYIKSLKFINHKQFVKKNLNINFSLIKIFDNIHKKGGK